MGDGSFIKYSQRNVWMLHFLLFFFQVLYIHIMKIHYNSEATFNKNRAGFYFEIYHNMIDVNIWQVR